MKNVIFAGVGGQGVGHNQLSCGLVTCHCGSYVLGCVVSLEFPPKESNLGATTKGVLTDHCGSRGPVPSDVA